MNNSTEKKCNCGAWAYGFAVLGAFLIVAGLVWAMQHYTRPEPLDAGRAQERAKALADLRAANADVLNNYAWMDQPRGIVRLPIAQAMKQAEAAWQKDPAAARANLIAREAKATAVLANPFD